MGGKFKHGNDLVPAEMKPFCNFVNGGSFRRSRDVSEQGQTLPNRLVHGFSLMFLSFRFPVTTEPHFQGKEDFQRRRQMSWAHELAESRPNLAKWAIPGIVR